MDNNLIKVQLASSAILGMKIESKQRNTISNSDQNFENLLNIVSEQKVWKKELNGNLDLPLSLNQEIKIWSGDTHITNENLQLALDAEPFKMSISEASSRYGVPESIINAVIKAESSFNPNATSSAGAKGLMQLMDGTARGLGITDSYDPAQNINGGTKYLSMLLKKFDGELSVALAAYNAGPTRVDRTGIATNEDFAQSHTLLPEETQNYVRKVLSYL